MSDLVSVVIPVYNTEKYIKKCLESIINQTYKDIEIIAVDDGSVDNSIGIVQEELEHCKRKFKILKQKNQGVSVARNRGIEASSGCWIIAVDSDDYLDRNAIERIVDVGEKNSVSAVFFDYEIEKCKHKPGSEERYEALVIDGKQAIEEYFNRSRNYIAPACCVKKEFLLKNAIHYDEGCRFAEDDIYVWKVLARAESIAYINKKMYHYVVHNCSIMTSSSVEKFISVIAPSKRIEEEYIKHSENCVKIEAVFLLRHFMGVLHVAAKNISLSDYMSLINYMNYKSLLSQAGHCQNSKIFYYFIAYLPRISYWMFRKK